MEKEYHILSLSGGKDSTALAFFMKDNMPEIFEKLELVFCDTECELPETYDYLNKIEIFLDKKIHWVKPDRSFEHLMITHGYLPSPIHRWCTVELKTKPFKKFVNFRLINNGLIYLYIGIRADELQRAEYNKYNNHRVKEVYPFVDYYNIAKQPDLFISGIKSIKNKQYLSLTRTIPMSDWVIVGLISTDDLYSKSHST